MEFPPKRKLDIITVAASKPSPLELKTKEERNLQIESNWQKQTKEIILPVGNPDPFNSPTSEFKLTEEGRKQIKALWERAYNNIPTGNIGTW